MTRIEHPVPKLATVLPWKSFIFANCVLRSLADVVLNIEITKKQLILQWLNFRSCIQVDAISKRIELESWDWSQIEEQEEIVLPYIELLWQSIFYILVSQNHIWRDWNGKMVA